MAKHKTKTSTAASSKPNLISPRKEVKEEIKDRIGKGKEIQSTKISSEADIDIISKKYEKWDDYNIEYLTRCFDSEVIAKEYKDVLLCSSIKMKPSIQDLANQGKEAIRNKITKLESILERLPLIPELDSGTSSGILTLQQSKNNVFVVHGHDDSAKANVARFVEKLGLNATILHEEPNKGKTIIEKFEVHAANAGFAIALLTPDDMGYPKDAEDKAKPRARQNVIFELGYFCGLLGRNKVCALHKGDIEIPNDYLSIVYIPLDENEGWKTKLVTEMKSAGLDIDYNRIISK